MSYEPQPVEFDGELVHGPGRPLTQKEIDELYEALTINDKTSWNLKGCFWPPTFAHRRTCRSCQQMIEKGRLEAEMEGRKS